MRSRHLRGDRFGIPVPRYTAGRHGERFATSLHWRIKPPIVGKAVIRRSDCYADDGRINRQQRAC